MVRFTAMALCALVIGVSTVASAATAPARERILLPSSVTPSHYDLTIIPDAAAMRFKGDVAIKLRVAADTNSIMVNAVELEFGAITLDGVAQTPKVSFDADNGTATMDFGRPVKSGEHVLKIAYSGKVFTTSAGLFAADYKTPNGNERLLATQFEPADARRFLPCFDEPGLKATYTVTTIVPENRMAVSNMPEDVREPAGAGLVKIRFKPTPKMSSYLLFYALGDFERRSKMVDGVDVGVITKRGSLDDADYALDAASKILPYFNDYFGTKFPLPKLDLIAVPLSGGFGAMENWGAVLYFERAMLLDPKTATAERQQGVFNVIAHETAHQWFGDLVTMAWWDDLWLNEGYASWMATKTSAHFHPEWKPWAKAEGAKQFAIGLDAVPSHHAIVQPVYSARGATESFDGITYQKGQAVIRMLESYVGADTFRDGVRRYMKKHAYGNAVTSDLWREIEAAGGKGVTGIARDFTVQPGVPLVTVTGVKCINGQSKVDVTLDRFALQPIKTPVPVWSVPITLRAGDASPTKVTTRKATTITTPGCGPVIVNAGQNSYFVTVYDKAAFAGVVEAFAKASLEDQLGLLANADLAGTAGIKPVTDYLDLAHVAPVDADPLVWLNIMGQLRGFDHNYADGNPRQAKFRTFARSIAEPLFAKLGWETREGDSANTIQLRQGLIWSLARFGSPDIIAGARARFDALVADPQSLKGDLRETVLRIVGYYADGPTFDRLAELANKTQSDLERRQFLGAIALVKDKAIAARARDYFLSPEVPATAAPRLLATMAANHPDETWSFGKQHWSDLKTRLDSLESLRYLPGLAAGSFDPAVIDDMRAFVKQNLPPEAEKAAGNTESSIRLNMRGRNEHVPEIDKWLDRVGN